MKTAVNYDKTASGVTEGQFKTEHGQKPTTFQNRHQVQTSQ